MKQGRIGKLTIALGLVIIIIYGLRVYLLPNQIGPEQEVGLIKKNPVPLNKPTSSKLPDFVNMQNVVLKKQAFFSFLRPLVELQNLQIKKERAFLISIRTILDSGSTISESAQFRLQKLAQKYQYKLIAIDDKLLNALLKRVDEIPVSLVLIQAANETGWGTSRFAREGLNFFGEWCFTSGCGLVPNSRTSGKTHEVEVFDSVADSVASYMLNLNSNSAYSLLRSIRFQLRQQGMQPTAEELVYGLVNYSERKDAYIDELLEMLRHNKKYLVN